MKWQCLLIIKKMKEKSRSACVCVREGESSWTVDYSEGLRSRIFLLLARKQFAGHF